MAIYTEHTYLESDISDLVSEKEKDKDPYLKGNIDYAIHNLVSDNKDIQKAYDFYNGIRDAAEFAYLEDNFGIGNPTSIKFVPLIKKHLSVLLGQQLTNPLNYKVTCADAKTLDNIRQEKSRSVISQIFSKVQARIASFQTNPSLLMQGAPAAPGAQASTVDFLNERFIEDLRSKYGEDFVSANERIANHVTSYLIYQGDLKLKFNTLMEDLLVSGRSYYRTVLNEVGQDPELEVINPKNLFYRKSTNQRYIKYCSRVVHRKQMTRSEILNKLGHLMDKKELEMIAGRKASDVLSSYSIRHGSDLADPKVSFNYDKMNGGSYSEGLDLDESIEVYHVEWLANNRIPIGENGVDLPVESKDKVKSYRFRLDRYEGYRIGDSIYLQMGKSKYVSREIDKPYLCTLSYNGLCYNDRNGEPYSMVLKTKDLQDKYDILYYFLENLVATSGGKGVHVHFPSIPVWLDETDKNKRVMKYLAYLKQGLNLIDDSQDGVKQFSNYGDYSMALDSSVKVIVEILQFLEETASSITGVNRQTLGQIESQDGLGNTNISMTQSALITKPLFQLNQELIKHALTDMLNLARIAYKEGKKGSYILGEADRHTFTVDPKKFCLSDYNIFLSDSGTEVKDLDAIKQLTMELVKGQLVSADVAVNMITLKSLTQVKSMVSNHIKQGEKLKLEELTKQVEQLNGELTKMQTALKQAELQADQIRQREIAIKELAEKGKLQLENRALSQEKYYQEQELALDRVRVALEREQISAQGNAKEVKNN